MQPLATPVPKISADFHQVSLNNIPIIQKTAMINYPAPETYPSHNKRGSLPLLHHQWPLKPTEFIPINWRPIQPPIPRLGTTSKTTTWNKKEKLADYCILSFNNPP